MKSMRKEYFDVVIERYDANDELVETYFSVTGNICPAEPDVGIPSAYFEIDEYNILDGVLGDLTAREFDELYEACEKEIGLRSY